MKGWWANRNALRLKFLWTPCVNGAVVTELSGQLHPSAQIPSISILDEILLICKQPRVNSFYRARLSPLSTRPKGINTNMKNLDSIPRRPHRRLSLHTNRITSHAHAITAPLYSPAGGRRHPPSTPFGGRNQKCFAFSSSQLISWGGSEGVGRSRRGGGVRTAWQSVWKPGKHPNYLISLSSVSFVALGERCRAAFQVCK